MFVQYYLFKDICKVDSLLRWTYSFPLSRSLSQAKRRFLCYPEKYCLPPKQRLGSPLIKDQGSPTLGFLNCDAYPVHLQHLPKPLCPQRPWEGKRIWCKQNCYKHEVHTAACPMNNKVLCLRPRSIMFSALIRGTVGGSHSSPQAGWISGLSQFLTKCGSHFFSCTWFTATGIYATLAGLLQSKTTFWEISL